jgi:siroheme synthase-like protein
MTPRRSPLKFLPVGIDVRGKECLVVGGGAVGTRKVATLARAGARVTIVSPTVTDELRSLTEQDTLRWIAGPYHESHARGAFLVVAATSDPQLNATVVDQARQAGALACDASSGNGSQLIFGALLESHGATIAVFTDGKDPAYARRTRDHLAHLIEQDRNRGSR